jgi:hypothetical protein
MERPPTRQERRLAARKARRAAQRVAASAHSNLPASITPPHQPQTATEGHGWLPWRERYRNFVSLGATGLLTGVAATAFTAADMLIAGILFGLVWLASALIVLIAPNWSRRLKATAQTIITLLLVGLYGIAYSRHEDPQTPTSILESQLGKLKQLEEFIGVKSEISLRDTFDLPNMVHYNILLGQRDHRAPSISPALSAEIDAYFKNSEQRFRFGYVRITTLPGGTSKVDPMPGKVGRILLSAAYLDSVKKLQEFESSSLLPYDVRTALKEFDKTIDEDVNLMFEVFTDVVNQGEDRLLGQYDLSSPYFGVLTNSYWDKFINLRPKADNLNTAMRSYLKIK